MVTPMRTRPDSPTCAGSVRRSWDVASQRWRGADFGRLGERSVTVRVADPHRQSTFTGANLTLLLAFVLSAARWLGVRGWWLRGVGLLGVVVFVALCRTEPSVLRAAAMGLVALAALGLGGGRA